MNDGGDIISNLLRADSNNISRRSSTATAASGSIRKPSSCSFRTVVKSTSGSMAWLRGQVGPLLEAPGDKIADLRSYKADGLRAVGEILNETIGDTYTYYIRLDDDASADRSATFLGNLTLQVEKVCEDLASHPILSKAPAINAIGFSQGGQFMRAYVERCNKPRVANLVTFGSQHNGISDFQQCGSSDWVCQSWSGLLKGNTWSALVQSRLVPAQYFRNPEDLEKYLKNSNFLADINNEREVKNKTYTQNMINLDKFAMYMFSEDTTVIPKETSHFSEVNTTSGKVTKIQDRDIYKHDWIGLRWLDEWGRLDFRIAEGGHMQFADGVLEDCFTTYFKSTA